MPKCNYPSVTTCLGVWTDFSMIPPARLEFACARGSKIHKFIEDDLAGQWIIPDLITPEIEQYWESYTIFRDQMIEDTIFAEKELVCDGYGFIGHLDWCGILKGEDGVTVLDWKSPVSEGKTWRSQLAAYWHLVEKHGGLPRGLKVKRCGALMLSPKGHPPRMKEYTEFRSNFFNDFLYALGAYKAFKGE